MRTCVAGMSSGTSTNSVPVRPMIPGQKSPEKKRRKETKDMGFNPALDKRLLMVPVGVTVSDALLMETSP